MRFLVSILALAAAAALVVPGLANAAVRTVSFSDPNDARPALSGGQDEDVRSVTVSYDDAGTITYTASFYASLNGSPHSDLSLGATLTSGVSTYSEGCDILAKPWGSIFVSPKSGRASFSIFESTGSLTGTVSLSADGSSLTTTFSSPTLANQNFRCAEADDLRVHFYQFSYCDFSGCPRTSFVIDEMPVGRWFDGFAPACDDGVDNDEDGTVDSNDATCNSRLGQSEGPPNAAPKLSNLSVRLTGKGKLRMLQGSVRVCDDRAGIVSLKFRQHKTALSSSTSLASASGTVRGGGCRNFFFKQKLLWQRSPKILLRVEATDSKSLAATTSRVIRVPVDT